MQIIDLFSGCGGMTQGFINAGYKVIAAFDYWEAAINVYIKNFDHPIYPVDLSKSNVRNYLIDTFHPEMIIGGPPCQDFSSAGKRNETLGRANLTVNFANIVTSMRPGWFVMENVDMAVKSKKYQEAIEIFRSAGYGMTMEILNSSFYGVPQIRKRTFLIGQLGGQDNAVSPYMKTKLTPNGVNVREHWEKIGLPLNFEHYYRHPRSYQRRGIFSVDEPSPTIRGVNRPVPPNYVNHPGDKAYLNENIRALTTTERSYIQTFPVGFVFDGSKTNLELMIGNAVPVKLAEFVARCVLEYEEDRF